jgi:tRNA (adenine-N(1)-)-methyltransferase non-catalytic subunit
LFRSFLRIDSLSQMLSGCNIMSNGKYIVVDTHLGILTAAVLERIGFSGVVIQVYTDPGPVTTYRQAVDALNIPKDKYNDILFGLQIKHAYHLLNDNQNYTESADNINTNNEFMESTSNEVMDEKGIRKQIRRIEAIKAKEFLKNKNMDGLLILTKNYDPLNILDLLIEFVGNSRPFAVFSATIEPLVECYTKIRKKAIFLKLSETWVRKYQVLPERTRPEMNMSGSGGYLLTGIKVQQ